MPRASPNALSRKIKRQIEQAGRGPPADCLVRAATPARRPRGCADGQPTFCRGVKDRAFGAMPAALPEMRKGAVIVNTASITAFKGNAVLVDYSSTKGAIVSLTRALAVQQPEKGIRVNAVAPGPSARSLS